MKEASELFDETPGGNAWLLIISLLTIALGVYVLLNPITALVGLALYIGFAFVLIGFGYLMIFQESKNYLFLSLGILDIIIGILLLINIGLTTAGLPLIIALWVLSGGVIQFAEAWRMKDDKMSAWIWFLISGLISIVFAFFIVIWPVISMEAITFLIGAYFIFYGVSELIRYIRRI